MSQPQSTGRNGTSSSTTLLAQQQKRFEVILKRVENRECFDCTAKQPRWASTNLGIFFCLRCAGIHRSLGVHISKVKSTTMDLWEDAMIETCDRIGNANGRDLYEARLPASYRKPEANTDTSVVERVVRQKYEQKLFYAHDFEQLRDRMLASVPRDAAPTPTPSTPTFAAAFSSNPPPSTPTYSTGVLSPTSVAGGGGESPAMADWTGFHSSPTMPPSSLRQTQPPAQQGVAVVRQQQQQPAFDDMWGSFSTAAAVATPPPQATAMVPRTLVATSGGGGGGASASGAMPNLFGSSAFSSSSQPSSAVLPSNMGAASSPSAAPAGSLDHFFAPTTAAARPTVSNPDLIVFGGASGGTTTSAGNTANQHAAATAEILSLFRQPSNTGSSSSSSPFSVAPAPGGNRSGMS